MSIAAAFISGVLFGVWLCWWVLRGPPQPLPPALCPHGIAGDACPVCYR